ncbi:MAG: TIGR02301 family protein [Shinella sp.]|nr:TIGR02301 family protein [Shinella sp.]
MPGFSLACRLAVSCALAWLLAAAVASAQQPAQGQPAAPPAGTEKTAPYDERLERLSEILGAVHYLRNLCIGKGEDAWRNNMQQLLDLEARNESGRKERLTAAFNRGYRSFASVYTSCTPPAVVAEERYRNEGATLASEITARFGN